MVADQHRPTRDPRRKVAETDLARAWAGNRFPSPGLQTVAGVGVTVADPGQQNSDSGPDFLDAVIRFADGPVERGPIELHRRPSDWRAHGHESDPAFSNILLHVVVDADGHGEIAGRPIVELPMHRPGRSSTKATRHVTIRQLERLGDARFEASSAQIEGDIAAVGVDQTLYEGLMGALGYTKNSEGFRKLARLVPFSVLREFGSSVPAEQGELRIAGLLFGAAGLLPTQRMGESRGTPDRYSTDVTDVWTRLGDGPHLPPEAWRTFRVRPDNMPVRRISAVTALVSKGLDNNLIHLMLRLAQMDDPHRAAISLVRVLEVGAEGYWGTRRDFGTPRSGGGGSAALIGRSRALEITTSVALQFLLAFADWNTDRLLETRVRSMFAALPAGPDNSLARWAAQRSLPLSMRRQRLTARQQQELLFVAKALI